MCFRWRNSRACERVLHEEGAQALQYGTTEGYRPLREMIARHTARYGINITPDNIMITSGSQQALDLIGKVFINRGDRILVEEPTYLGALQAWNAYGAEYVTVPMDDDGMNHRCAGSSAAHWSKIHLCAAEFPKSHRRDPIPGAPQEADRAG